MKTEEIFLREDSSMKNLRQIFIWGKKREFTILDDEKFVDEEEKDFLFTFEIVKKMNK